MWKGKGKRAQPRLKSFCTYELCGAEGAFGKLYGEKESEAEQNEACARI